MEKINIHTVKTQLSRLIAERKKVIIERYGQRAAKLVPAKKWRQDREPGSAKGKIRMRDDFFDPLPDDIQNEFYK